ncbi:MAG: hypothetical protein IPI46_10165 [Bacteroidetes bacterium]|nr:hypothetical protein [Bacteroidota bacterium]
MNKKNKPVARQEKSIPQRNEIKESPVEIIADPSTSFSWLSKLTTGWIPYAIIALLGIVLYANTIHHEFALDDDIIICKNEHVLKGMGGMGDIMTKDVFDSYYKSLNLTAQLAGGRYRPFSVATYAIEQEFIGTLPNGLQKDSWDINHNKITDANEDVNKDGLFTDRDFKVRGTSMRHINNIWLYVLGVCLIYMFLSTYFFKDNKLLALLTALLFLAHPLHSEVVANMKSRDEILSLMFIVLTLHLSFKYIADKNIKTLVFACIAYFIALLSKEYGATLLVIVPLGLFVYYKQLKFSDIVLLMGGLVIVFGIYYKLRSGVVLDIGESSVQDSELLNNPYLLATEAQAAATKLFINLKYFILLLFPYAMSSDYSYNVIPYMNYSDIGVIASILMLLGAAAGLVYTIRKRSWLAFPIAFALLHLVLVNNMFFNIGATMGERLVYHTSLGTCILMVFGLYYLFTKVLKLNGNYIVFIVLPIVVLYTMKTITRNPAWKNDYTLTMTDVKTYPNSIMLLGNACNRLIEMSEFPKNKKFEKQFLDSAANYGRKALAMHPRYVTTYLNMGMIKMKQSQVDSAAHYWDKVIEYFPVHPNVPQIRQFLSQNYMKAAGDFSNARNYNAALNEYLKAYKYIPQDAGLNYNIGVMYSAMQNPAKAKEYWVNGLKNNPGDANLQNAVRSVGGM